ncbi:abhydrolase domain containing, putative [Ricinus communis]|uniref:Abhydrolase domain containing, putative n=1 Tax=Ricinus communis TaxID=3988 RepID=B9RQY4_RICCO|nr:abhydrolase domain containing, putative [Ricinus communis]
MAPFFLSPISLYSVYLRFCFTSSGLSRQAVDIDDNTTLHFWGPDPGKKITTIHKPSLILIHGFGPISLFQWRKLGVEKYSVMGTSYGGVVAYHMARMWPERIEKVVIANSGVNMKRSDNEELVRKSKLGSIGDLMLPKEVSQLRTLMRLAVYGRSIHMIPGFFLNDFIHQLYTKNRSQKLELLKGVIFGKNETVNISPLQQDVLLIWGDHDQIFPLDMAYELKGLIGKKVKLESIKDASHVPQIEKPIQFNNIVNSFLSG